MDKQRSLELLAHAKVCFDHCTNPFAPNHLLKNQVTADECRDLAFELASILENELLLQAPQETVNAFLKQAELNYKGVEETL